MWWSSEYFWRLITFFLYEKYLKVHWKVSFTTTTFFTQLYIYDIFYKKHVSLNISIKPFISFSFPLILHGPWRKFDIDSRVDISVSLICRVEERIFCFWNDTKISLNVRIKRLTKLGTLVIKLNNRRALYEILGYLFLLKFLYVTKFYLSIISYVWFLYQWS